MHVNLVYEKVDALWKSTFKVGYIISFSIGIIGSILLFPPPPLLPPAGSMDAQGFNV